MSILPLRRMGGTTLERDVVHAPNGLELGRPASPELVSRQLQHLGWWGRLRRVVWRKEAGRLAEPPGTLGVRSRSSCASGIPP